MDNKVQKFLSELRKKPSNALSHLQLEEELKDQSLLKSNDDLSIKKAKKALYHLQLEAELEDQIRLRPDWNKHIFR